jgi:hypothetical protein
MATIRKTWKNNTKTENKLNRTQQKMKRHTFLNSSYTEE